MSRRAAVADITQTMTRKGAKSDVKRRATQSGLKLSKGRSSSVKLGAGESKSTPRRDLDTAAEGTLIESVKKKNEKGEKDGGESEMVEFNFTDPAGVEITDNSVKISEPVAKEGDSQPLGEGEQAENSEAIIELVEGPQEGQEEGDEQKQAEEEEEKKTEKKAKKMTKKQLREEKKRLEEERIREAARKKREERRQRRMQEQAHQEQEEEQVFDEAAFKEYIYGRVGDSLSMVMNKGDLNITVDNVTQLLKSMEINSSDERIQDLIMDSLIDSLGMIDPKALDDIVLQKKMETDLDDLEECVDTAFAIIDQDQDGLITHNDVYKLMIHLGEILWENEVADMIKAADFDGDGRISKNDLFLFLLGQKKRVKLEDSIMQRLGGGTEDDTTAEAKPAASGDSESSTKDQTSETPANTASTITKKVEFPSSAEGCVNTQPSVEEENSTSESATTSATATASSTKFTVAAPTVDPAVAERRRMMFSGYAKAAVAVNRLAEGSQGMRESTINAEEAAKVSPDDGVKIGLDNVKETASHAEDEKLFPTDKDESSPDSICEPTASFGDDSEIFVSSNADTAENCAEESSSDHQPFDRLSDFQPFDKENNQTGVLPSNQGAAVLANGDWSDSGHVGSDRDDDDHDESDEEMTSDDGPLALDENLYLLPVPEYDGVLSPRAACSLLPSSSPRLHCYDPDGIRMESPIQTSTSKEHKDAMMALTLDMDRPVSSTTSEFHLTLPALDPRRDGDDGLLTDRTSEYDSGSEEGKDGEEQSSEEEWLPQSSQQNVILREIENQVLNTRRALSAKTHREKQLRRDARKQSVRKMDCSLSDGNESVIEAEIRPVYVPPCAREAGGFQRFSINYGQPDVNQNGTLGTIHGKGIKPSPAEQRSKLGQQSEQQQDEGIGSAESHVHHDLASMTTEELLSKGYVSLSTPRSGSVWQQTPRDRVEEFLEGQEGCQDGDEQFNAHEDSLEDQDLNGYVFENGSIPETSVHEGDLNERIKDILIDGIPDTLRPTCSRVHNLPTRRPSRAPLRRSLTCHIVTVKDLAPKDNRPAFLRRDSSAGRGDSSLPRRDSVLERRESSLGRTQTGPSRDGSPGHGEAVLSRGESLRSRRDSFISRKGSSLSRIQSPLSRKDSAVRSTAESFRERGDSRRPNSSSTERRESTVGRRESPERGGTEFTGDRRGSPLGLRRPSVRYGDSPVSWKKFSLGRLDSARSLVDSARDSSRGDSTWRDSARRESSRGDSSWRDSARRDSSRGDTTSRESGRKDSNRTHRDSVRSQIDSARTLITSSRSYRDSSRSHRTSSLGRTDDSTARSDRSGNLSNRYNEEEENNCDSSREFRFYGPNFHTIMQQKGEPEDRLTECLRRDSGGHFSRDSSYPSDARNGVRTAFGSGGYASTNGHSHPVSRQLERVKEMERLIQQKSELSRSDDEEGDMVSTPENSHNESHKRHQKITRSKTTICITTPTASSHEPKTPAPSERSSFTSSSVRPKSCLISRRTMSNLGSKVVTIVDAQESLSAERESYQRRRPKSSGAWRLTHSDSSDANKKLHIVDLSSLLSAVNDPPQASALENSDSDDSADKRHGVAPLAKALVAFETARRSQAAAAMAGGKSGLAGDSGAAGPTAAPAGLSISRQLQQYGIPYHPPPPPPQDGEGCEGVSPLARRTTASSSHHHSETSVSQDDRHYSQSGRSFMLASDQNECADDSVFMDSSPKRLELGWGYDDRPPCGRVTSAHALFPRARSPTVTMEFPERAVCVVKLKRTVSIPKMAAD